MIVLDTSGILSLIDRRDGGHSAAREALATQPPPIVAALALAEAGYLVVERVGEPSFLRFLEGFHDGSTLLDCGDVDLPRIQELMARYANLPLGFADAAVIACAERNGGRVLTFDRRDFDVVAAEGTISIVP
jgi:predicted nucleic acid-binding protein